MFNRNLQNMFFRKSVVGQNSQNVFFRKSVVGQNSQNVFFRKSVGRDFRKVCTACRPEKNCRFLCTHHSSGECITWNSDMSDDENVMFWQNVRIFPGTPFFCKTHFVYKCVFQGVRNARIHIFVRHKKCAQNPEMWTCGDRSEKIWWFLWKIHSSGERISRTLRIPDDENSVFRQNVRIFPEATFFCKTRFVHKCCFQGVRTMCIHIFCRTQKICAKSRNVCTRLPTRKKLSVFV